MAQILSREDTERGVSFLLEGKTQGQVLSIGTPGGQYHVLHLSCKERKVRFYPPIHHVKDFLLEGSVNPGQSVVQEGLLQEGAQLRLLSGPPDSPHLTVMMVLSVQVLSEEDRIKAMPLFGV